jgi:hypothetical protein
MVYNTQNYWVFGLCPASGILETRKKKKKKKSFRHRICFHPQVRGGEAPTLLDTLGGGLRDPTE